jgi:tetratricopeptide (TPR) repeat protein
MDAPRNAAAWDAITRAKSLRAQASPIERAMIDALATRYAKNPPADRRPLDEAYAAAMASLWAEHPDDADIATLYAESQMDLRPWDLWTVDGQPKEGAPLIVATLDSALALDPNHPGANHLMIHAVEASFDPSRANVAADRLRNMVPASGHMVHMPSHIDVRTGRWPMAAEANERAIIVDEAYRALSPRQGFYRLYMAHDHHFLSYVSMMEGRSARSLSAAREMLAEVPADFAKTNATLMDPYLFIEVEALMRFGKWEELLKVKEPAKHFPVTRAMWRFGRGVALAALGRTDEAHREHGRLKEQIAAIPPEAMTIVNKAHDVLGIADLVLAGEIAFHEGDISGAIEALRAATMIEDRLVYMEPPEWMIPVRHPLGAMLIEAKMPAEAEREYREDLRRWPENGWSLNGLARALRAQGRESEAAEIERRFAKAWSRADVKIGASCWCVKHRLAAR